MKTALTLRPIAWLRPWWGGLTVAVFFLVMQTSGLAQDLCGYYNGGLSQFTVPVHPNFDGYTPNFYTSAVLLRGSHGGTANQGELLRPVFGCSPGQVGFVLRNNESQPVTAYLEVVRPTRVGLTSPPTYMNTPTIQLLGGLTGGYVATENQVNAGRTFVVDVFRFTVPADPGFGPVPCGTAILSYTQATNVQAPVLQINSRLRTCKGTNCNPVATGSSTVWNYLNPANYGPTTATVFDLAFTPYYANQALTAANLTAGPLVLAGNCSFAGASWPTGGDKPRFRMAPGAKLTLGPNTGSVSYTISNLQMEPCSRERHGGLVVRGSLGLTIQDAGGGNSLILHATEGIHLQRGARLAMTGGHISLPQTGIVLENAAEAYLTSVRIDQDPEVQSSSVVLPPPTGRGAIGIYVNQDGRLLPDGSGSINYVRLLATNCTIDSFATGIYATGFETEAQDIDVSGGTITHTGTGVKATNVNYSDLAVNGTVIKSADYGLDATDLDLSIVRVLNANVQSRNTAIRSSTFYDNYLRVENCQLQAPENGIYASGAYHTLRAANNTITLYTPPAPIGSYAAGVRFDGSVNGANVISGNRITLPTRRGLGVSLLNSSSTMISNNAVQTQYFVGGGIAVEGGQTNNVGCNYVQKVSGAAIPYDFSGIVIQNVTNPTATCNKTKDLKYGLQMLGISSNGSYRRNVFDNTTFGVAVGTPINTGGNYQVLIGGAQNFTDNEWIGANRAAAHYADQQWITENRFNLRNLVGYYPTFVDRPNWMIVLSTGTGVEACPSTCASVPPGWFGPPPGPGETEGASAKTQNARTDAAYGLAANNKSSNEEPSLVALAELEARLLGYALDLREKNTYERRLVALATYNVSKGDTEDAVAFRKAYFLPKEQVAAHKRAERNELESISTQIEKVRPATDQQARWKQSLELVVASRSPKGLDLDQQKQVTYLAERCAEVDGPGVSVARLLSPTPYSDIFTCQGQSEKLRLDIADAVAPLTVAPNLASAGQFLVLSRVPRGEISLYSLDGRLMKAYETSSTTTLRLPSSLSAGLYVIEVIEGDVTTALKLVIHD